MLATQIEVSDGTLTSVNVGIEFFEQGDISVALDQAVPLTLGTDYQWSAATTIQFLPTLNTPGGLVPAGVSVILRRSTEHTEMLNTYDGGAPFSRITLDENFEQLLRLSQEFSEGLGFDGLQNNLDMNGYRVLNLGDAIDPQDAVPLAQVQDLLEVVDDSIRDDFTAADAALQDQILGITPPAGSQFSMISWHDQEILNSITIPDNKNAWSFGPTVGVAPGQTVTIGEDSFWTIADGSLQAPVQGVSTIADLRVLPAPVLAAGRTLLVNVAGHSSVGDLGQGLWYWQGNSNEADDNATVVLPMGYVGVGRWKRSIDLFVNPEMFGCVGDYDIVTLTGTDNTVNMRKWWNFCHNKGVEGRLLGTSKFLTDTLYGFNDPVLNPDWVGRKGRIRISGGVTGHATGALETQGNALIHINGAARPLIDITGVFNIATPTAMAGYFQFSHINFVGGNQTTDVLHLQGAQGSIELTNYTVKVVNPAGNGIVEATTWEVSHNQGLIRGGASGLGTWTGTGLNITSDGTDGQINMKVYKNVDCYGMGYGIRIGRQHEAIGTCGPLVIIGGQVSNSDQHGLWMDGGAINFTSIGQQIEGSRKNAIRIDRVLEDATVVTDLTRNAKFINTYITGSGNIEDGTADSYAVYIANGDGIEFDSLLFNNAGNSIGFDAGEVDNLMIRRPVWRTVRTYGTTSGTGIKAFGTQDASKRQYLEHPTFNQNPATQIDSVALQVFARGRVGGRLSFSANSAAPSLSLGGATGSESVRLCNFNYSTPVTLTNITGAQLFEVVTFTFSNTNVTIPNNRSTFFLNGAAFTPTSGRSILRMYWDGSAWIEVSRSLGSNSWVDLVLQNSWVKIASRVARYRQSGDSVQVELQVISGTATDGTVIATLPVGFRPLATFAVNVLAAPATTPSSSVVQPRLVFNTDGTITCHNVTSANGLCGMYQFSTT